MEWGWLDLWWQTLCRHVQCGEAVLARGGRRVSLGGKQLTHESVGLEARRGIWQMARKHQTGDATFRDLAGECGEWQSMRPQQVFLPGETRVKSSSSGAAVDHEAVGGSTCGTTVHSSGSSSSFFLSWSEAAPRVTRASIGCPFWKM